MGIGLAQDVVLEGQDAVVVGRAAKQHGAGRHQRAFGLLDQLHVAGAAGLARHPVVRRIYEADELRRFPVEQSVALLGIGRMRIVPGFREARQDVRPVAHGRIGRRGLAQVRRSGGAGVAAVTVHAPQHDGRRPVHARGVGRRVATDAAHALALRLLLGLALRSGRGGVVDALDRLFLFAGAQGQRRGKGQ